MTYVITVVEHIPEVIRASGIQILIFLAGLQSIPCMRRRRWKGVSWQTFWMITMPMMTIVLANVVYSIIGSFLRLQMHWSCISDTAFAGAGWHRDSDGRDMLSPQ